MGSVETESPFSMNNLLPVLAHWGLRLDHTKMYTQDLFFNVLSSISSWIEL